MLISSILLISLISSLQNSIVSADVMSNTKFLSLYNVINNKLNHLRQDTEEKDIDIFGCCNNTTSSSPSTSLSLSPSAQPTTRYETVYNAMWKIYTSLGIPESDLTGTTYCTWTGVRCSGVEVRAIELSKVGLGGSLATEIGILDELTSLHFEYNYLEQTIPTELGSLSNLWFLRLSNQFISGTIPSELGNLQSLEYMYIHCNEFISGTVPSEIYDSLPNLLALEIWANQLTGTIPDESFPDSLDWYGIGMNQMTGTIPESISMVGEGFFLADNEFSSTLPSEIGDSSARIMIFDYNQLTGSIPTEVDNLDQLEVFAIVGNTGMSGTAPSSLCGIDYFYYFGTSVTCA